MRTRSRCLLILTMPLALLVSACGSTASSSTASPTPVSAATSQVPTSAVASPSSSATVGQTDTAWGRIWDAVPAGFPRFPASTPADDAGADPVSARLSVSGGDPRAIATWMQGALEGARFDTVGLNGPAEDGSYVLDSVGAGDCHVQTTIAPLGDTTFISVLYGTDCPAVL